MRFHTREQESTWLVSRELLSDGLLSPAGREAIDFDMLLKDLLS